MGSCQSQVSFFLLLLDLSFISYRPVNKEELFNLRHASARNVIEHIFGVLKRRFRILLLAPEYNLEIQARIPAALCSIHNFIRTHASDFDQFDEDKDLPPQYIDDHDDHDIPEAATLWPEEPSARRDQIAQQMWDDYVEICNERDREAQEDDDEDENEDEDDDDEFEDDDA
jgi:hypothetical protein